jgi:acyl-CoA reductase-like NAD-dependent aldehyde dehydrogenase
MYPLSIVCGNTYVLKPSERVANASIMLGEMVQGYIYTYNRNWFTEGRV